MTDDLERLRRELLQGDPQAAERALTLARRQGDSQTLREIQNMLTNTSAQLEEIQVNATLDSDGDCRVETRFTLHNMSDEEIESVLVSIILRDAQGRAIFAVKEALECVVEPGERETGETYTFTALPVQPAFADIVVHVRGFTRIALSPVTLEEQEPQSFFWPASQVRAAGVACDFPELSLTVGARKQDHHPVYLYLRACNVGAAFIPRLEFSMRAESRKGKDLDVDSLHSEWSLAVGQSNVFSESFDINARAVRGASLHPQVLVYYDIARAESLGVAVTQRDDFAFADEEMDVNPFSDFGENPFD